MARGGGSLEGCVGCVVLVAIVGAVVTFGIQVANDQAVRPAPRQGGPELQSMEVHVTGDDGGAYEVFYTLDKPNGKLFGRGRAENVLKEEPEIYPIDVDGFVSDGDRNFFLNSELYVDTNKTEPWEGDLAIVLVVNGRPVACANRDATRPGAPGGASVEFDPDASDQYGRDWGCQLYLWFL